MPRGGSPSVLEYMTRDDGGCRHPRRRVPSLCPGVVVGRIVANWPERPARGKSMSLNKIQIRGARTHNLRGIDLDLRATGSIVLTGLSGSGKSSLAFDTLYAEGHAATSSRLSAYARQFLSMMEKPDVDHIEGLSPAISIEQKSTSHNPRSTVGTVTEIYDYLRLLYARAGIPRCPDTADRLEAQTVSQMVDPVLALPAGTRIMLLAPVVAARKGEHRQLLRELRAQGFVRARIDGEVIELDDPPKLERSAEARHRGRDRPLRVRPRSSSGSPNRSRRRCARRRRGARRVMDEPEREELVFSTRFAARLRLQHHGARAAAVLVQ